MKQRNRRGAALGVVGALLGSVGILGTASPVAAVTATPVVFIGDSITELCSTDYNSYRDDTLAGLAAAGYLIDATGTRSGSGCYPTDDEHEGLAGATTSQIAARIPAALAATPEVPSVAFILAGTNDVKDDVAVATSLANLNSIIGSLRAENSAIHVILGQIPAYPAKQTQTADLNAAIATLAVGGASPITVVDLNSGIGPAQLDTDEIHLNAAGAQLVGARVRDAMIATGRLARPVVLQFAPFETESHFVRTQYLDFLDRPAEPTGLAYWTGITNDDRSNVPTIIEAFMRSPEFAPRRGVARLYRAFFDRNPDIEGFDYWTSRIATGQATLDTVSQWFVGSPEFVSIYGALTDPQFVALVYANVLGRTPDQAGNSFWLGQMARGMTRGQVMTRFSESPEYVTLTRPKIDVVVTYRGMFDRPPDDAGFEYWHTRLAGDPASLSVLINNLYYSSEYAQRVQS
jgi:lysophospholipase L1-like esterase